MFINNAWPGTPMMKRSIALHHLEEICKWFSRLLGIRKQRSGTSGGFWKFGISGLTQLFPNISSFCNCNHFVASYFNFQSVRIFLKFQLFTFRSTRIWQQSEERLTALVWILSSGISFEIIREEEVEQAFNWNAIPLLWSNSIHQSRLIMMMMMMITMMMTIPLV